MCMGQNFRSKIVNRPYGFDDDDDGTYVIDLVQRVLLMVERVLREYLDTLNKSSLPVETIEDRVSHFAAYIRDRSEAPHSRQTTNQSGRNRQD